MGHNLSHYFFYLQLRMTWIFFNPLFHTCSDVNILVQFSHIALCICFRNSGLYILFQH